MEPQLPRPQIGPEFTRTAHQEFSRGEAIGRVGAETQQHSVEKVGETREALHDGPSGDPGAVQAAFTPPPIPVIDPAQGISSADPGQVATQGPATAADDDLIEKAWVEKAKKIIADNQGDPHAQDAAISKLQADYLKKRYGKTIVLAKEE